MYKYLLLLLVMFSTSVVRAEEVKINLPKPNMIMKAPLMEALNNRKSIKFYGKRGITEQTLADILWSAVGTNRDDGRRTIPTSMNSQDIYVYVLKADGSWLYNAKYHRLVRINDKDLRFLTAKQDYVLKAAVVLVYTSTLDDLTAGMHAGSAYQNVGLYSAAVGLGNAVRAYFDKEDIAKELNLPENEKVIVSQTIGWPRD